MTLIALVMMILLGVAVLVAVGAILARRGLPRAPRVTPQQIAAAGPQVFDAQFWRPGGRAVLSGFGRLTVSGDTLAFQPQEAGGAPFVVSVRAVHARALEGGVDGSLWLWTPETGDLHGVVSRDYLDRLGSQGPTGLRELRATAELIEVMRALGGRV